MVDEQEPTLEQLMEMARTLNIEGINLNIPDNLYQWLGEDVINPFPDGSSINITAYPGWVEDKSFDYYFQGENVPQTPFEDVIAQWEQRRNELVNQQNILQAEYDSLFVDLTNLTTNRSEPFLSTDDWLMQALGKDQEQEGEMGVFTPEVLFPFDGEGLSKSQLFESIDFSQVNETVDLKTLADGIVLLGTLRAQIISIPEEVEGVSFAGVIASATTFANTFQQQLFLAAQNIRARGIEDVFAALLAILAKLATIAYWIALISMTIAMINQWLRKLQQMMVAFLENILFTKRGNIRNEYNDLAEQLAREQNIDVCEALRRLYNSITDQRERQKIKTAQKAAGCRRHR